MRDLLLTLVVLTLGPLYLFADKPIPIPQPPLAHLEESVSKQLREGRKMVDSITQLTSVSPRKRADAYGEMGRLYHAYELNDAAEVCYRNAIALAPGNYDWTYSLAHLLQSIGGFKEALPLYKGLQETKLGTDQIYLIHIRIGQCLHHLNQPAKARAAYKAAHTLKPNGPAVLARLGMMALEEKKYDLAITYLSEALKQQPAANKLHYQLAMAYRYSNQLEKARHHLGLYGMVGVQPPDPLKKQLESLITGYRVHLLAGRLAYAAGRYNEAVESFKKAIAAKPQEHATRINLGSTLVKLGKYNEAIQEFQEVVRLKPDNITVHFNLGTFYAFLGDHGKAIHHLKKVVQLDPKDKIAHLNLGNSLVKTGRHSGQRELFREALQHFNTALDIDPGMAQAWLNVSDLFKSNRQYKDALHIIEQAYKRIPHNHSIIMALANLLAASPDISLRNGKRALLLARKLYKENPNYQNAQLIAIACAQLNQCDYALKWMAHAINLALKEPKSYAIIPGLQKLQKYFKTRKPCRPPGG